MSAVFYVSTGEESPDVRAFTRGDARPMVTVSLAERFAAPGSRMLPVLEREVSELMTPGVISIVENAPLARVFDAFAAHRVHALMVNGARTGRPVGWVTARGLLAWVGRPGSAPARDAITERAVSVRPSASGEQALKLLLGEGVSHLLVQERTSFAHDGEILGVPATGREVTFEGLVISRFREGKVVEEWSISDNLGLLQQIGGLPEMVES